MSQFSFPILENDELLQCLEEMEVSLDVNQLNKPTFEIVKPIMEQILIMLTGVTRYRAALHAALLGGPGAWQILTACVCLSLLCLCIGAGWVELWPVCTLHCASAHAHALQGGADTASVHSHGRV